MTAEHLKEFINETFYHTYNQAANKVFELECNDKEAYLIMTRIINRLYVQHFGVTFNSSVKSIIENGDL